MAPKLNCMCANPPEAAPQLGLVGLGRKPQLTSGSRTPGPPSSQATSSRRVSLIGPLAPELLLARTGRESPAQEKLRCLQRGAPFGERAGQMGPRGAAGRTLEKTRATKQNGQNLFLGTS